MAAPFIAGNLTFLPTPPGHSSPPVRGGHSPNDVFLFWNHQVMVSPQSGYACCVFQEGAWDAGGKRGRGGRTERGDFVAHFATFFGPLKPQSPMSL